MPTKEEMFSAWEKELPKKPSCQSLTEEKIRLKKIKLKKIKKRNALRIEQEYLTKQKEREQEREQEREEREQEREQEREEERKQILIKKTIKEENQMLHNLKVENNQLNSVVNSLKQAGENNYQKQQMLNASIATVKSLNDIDWQLSFDAADRRR